MPSALLLSMHNLGEWATKATDTPTPGGSLPYGLQYLRNNFEMTWSDAQRSGIWRTSLSRAIGGAIRRGAPGLQGSLGAFYAIPRLRTADVVLSVFENVGLGFARSQRLSEPARCSVPHVMLTCWLAEDCRRMSPSALRSVRRSIRSISKIAVFSANQVFILQDFFGISSERISVVTFGVDTSYYNPAIMSDSTGGGGGLVAVGGDSRRDYATLLRAVRIANVPLTLACFPRNITGLDLPPHVRLLSGISHDEYRRLVLSADLVVTPTVGPAYPSGQSVVLEAMSMGRATLTTDSPAIRDYVAHGANGLLVPPRDPAAMAELISALLADTDRRQSLGAAAAKTVRERFSLEHLWQSVSGLMIAAWQG